jgi:hypothetical protein
MDKGGLIMGGIGALVIYEVLGKRGPIRLSGDKRLLAAAVSGVFLAVIYPKVWAPLPPSHLLQEPEP